MGERPPSPDHLDSAPRSSNRGLILAQVPVR